MAARCLFVCDILPNPQFITKYSSAAAAVHIASPRAHSQTRSVSECKESHEEFEFWHFEQRTRLELVEQLDTLARSDRVNLQHVEGDGFGEGTARATRHN
jgi:hypothetical protein